MQTFSNACTHRDAFTQSSPNLSQREVHCLSACTFSHVECMPGGPIFTANAESLQCTLPMPAWHVMEAFAGMSSRLACWQSSPQCCCPRPPAPTRCTLFACPRHPASSCMPLLHSGPTPGGALVTALRGSKKSGLLADDGRWREALFQRRGHLSLEGCWHERLLPHCLWILYRHQAVPLKRQGVASAGRTCSSRLLGPAAAGSPCCSSCCSLLGRSSHPGPRCARGSAR